MKLKALLFTLLMLFTVLFAFSYEYNQSTVQGQSADSPEYPPHDLAPSGLELMVEPESQVSLSKRLDTRPLTRFFATSNLLDISAFEPTVPISTGPIAKVYAVDAGMNALSGAALIEAGVAAGTDLARLEITHEDAVIATEVLDDDGLLDAASEVRFFVDHPEHSPNVGNYWEAQEIYWVWTDATGLPMAERSAVPPADSSAPIRSTAFEKGIFEDNTKYESTMPGVDDDYWFHAAMIAESWMLGDPSVYPTIVIDLENKLPLANNAMPSDVTITGALRTVTTHKLDVELGDSVEMISWSNLQYYESFSHSFTSTVHSETVQLTLRPGVNRSSIRIDKIYWQQPVTLDFNQSGARFSTLAGAWRYNLSGLSTTAALYEISDTTAPVRMSLPAGAAVFMEDGTEARDYILVTADTLHQPMIEAYQAIEFPADYGADAIYIAPQEFHDELAALVAQRQDQGYEIAVVDVQDIYDVWSDGMVDPEAIRRFLRFAHLNWTPSPIAVTLVGDSTSDPRNYYGNQNGSQNVNIVPAYLAHIDPWIGQTACQNCFAELDGVNSPFSIEDPDLLIDIMIGRLSVQNEIQLADVVDKILRYESAPDGQFGRDTSVYIVDNYLSSDGIYDPSGDFAANADAIIADWQSPELATKRLYYDPNPDGVSDPWREPDADLARQRSLDLMNAGPALVTYVGRANHYQLAATESQGPHPYLVGFNDLYGLSNQDKLFIMLQMSSYTSQFSLAASSPSSGTVFDERLLRTRNGGAVATFGPAGLTVPYGSDWLAAGFHEKLAQDLADSAVSGDAILLGRLVEAGYQKLYTDGSCCQDARMTYLLLGDPLTQVRINRTADILPTPTPTPIANSEALCKVGAALNTVLPGAQSALSSYAFESLGAGWYSDYTAQQAPEHLNDVTYVQTIRIQTDANGDWTTVPDAAEIGRIAAQNLGAEWLIGNEPDRRALGDGLLPATYAEAYHDIYEQLKAADSTAQIFPGSIVQPTPLRLAYLELVLQSYNDTYGEPLPADGWAIHNYILNEASCEYFDNDLNECWGADIPLGVDAVEGLRIGLDGHIDVALFKQQLIDFRTWMSDNGYAGLPLYVTELGVLLPDYYTDPLDFSPAAVNQFMNETFDFMLDTTDSILGDPNDGFHLVQRFAWYSLNDDYRYGGQYNGALFRPDTFERTEIGDNFAAYVANRLETGSECIVDPPSSTPTAEPIDTPTSIPSDTPTPVPTDTPTLVPTETPTLVPTETPTLVPTDTPTLVPTDTPTLVPTDTPTLVPTDTPTLVPTDTPTLVPTETPTLVPTETPTLVPTETPTLVPTDTPTLVPTETPVGSGDINLVDDPALYLPFIQNEN